MNPKKNKIKVIVLLSIASQAKDDEGEIINGAEKPIRLSKWVIEKTQGSKYLSFTCDFRALLNGMHSWCWVWK
jgi:hypothetical protein